MTDHNSIRHPPRTLGGGTANAPRGAPGELQSTLALNGMGSFQWDLDSGVFSLDPGGLAVMDLSPDGFDERTETLGTRIVPEDRSVLRELVDRALVSRPDYGAYFRIRLTDGRVRWTHTQGHIFRDASGRARRVVGIVRDASGELQHAAEKAALEAARRRHTNVVQALTAALSQALSVNDVTTAVTSEETRAGIGAAAISLSVVEHGRTRLVAAVGLPEALTRDLSVSRLHEPMPFAEAVRTGIARFLDRDELRERYPRMWPYLEGTDLTRAAILPLVAQDRPIGALAFAYRDRYGFSPEERNLLLALGATIAQSLQRAVLHDQEHEMAVGLQRAMLPACIPPCPGTRIAVRYHPSGTAQGIGGDWYDVIPFPTGRVGIVVGDVEGHDVHAAAIMGQLRTALRAYAAEGHPPAAVIAHASAFLRDLDTEHFATCIYADLDPATGRAHVVRAGHLGPVVRHADSTCSHPHIPGGLPIGLPQPPGPTAYPTVDLQLHPGDTLLLCTDGLVEFHGMDLDDGLRQLETVLTSGPGPVEELADHVIETIEARSGRDDDVALLLVELNTPAEPTPSARIRP